MKESPQLMGIIAASAVVGGLALSRALTTGSTVAWCVTTACAVVTLFALVAAVQYLNWVKAPDQRTAADAYFDNWPEELDVLVSNTNEETRALAAAKVGTRASNLMWPYRMDAVRVLEYVISVPETPRDIQTSAIGALSDFQPESCLPIVIKLASNPTDPRNLLQACWTYLARTAAGRSKLDEIIRAVLPAHPYLEGCAMAALLTAYAKARPGKERAEVHEWMDRLLVECRGFRQAELNLSLRESKRRSMSPAKTLPTPEGNAEDSACHGDLPRLLQSLCAT